MPRMSAFLCVAAPPCPVHDPRHIPLFPERPCTVSRHAFTRPHVASAGRKTHAMTATTLGVDPLLRAADQFPLGRRVWKASNETVGKIAEKALSRVGPAHLRSALARGGTPPLAPDPEADSERSGSVDPLQRGTRREDREGGATAVPERRPSHEQSAVANRWGSPSASPRRGDGRTLSSSGHCVEPASRRSAPTRSMSPPENSR
jgi:hypothetical protein